MVTDNSFYTPPYQNTLVNSGATLGTVAAFGQSAKFTRTAGSKMEVAHNATHNFLTDKMTIESFVQLTTLPSDETNFPIASKMGSQGEYGWEMGLRKHGSKFYIYFSGSPNGTSAPVVVLSNKISLDTDLHHMAVTWNQGQIVFYLDGTPKGNGSLGTAYLYSSQAPLRLGAGLNQNYMNGTLDEVRISRKVRWSSAFTPPTQPYNAD